MRSTKSAVLPFATGRSWLGLAALSLGEGLILIRHRPESDFYFPLVWLGFVLILDSAIAAATGSSLWRSRRRVFLAMLPMSAAFWWLFELFNEAVHNWVYIGAERYTGLGYVLFATLDFSFVLLAVWNASVVVYGLLPRSGTASRSDTVPASVLIGSICAGILAVCLAVLLPRYFFGAIWLCMFLLLDPVNAWLGRPSILVAAWQRNWRLPVALALGTLVCGFFWEAWNYWSIPRWIYTIPYVHTLHIFEMPLLGWSGYLPFGLELFAMTNFVLPLLGLGTLTIEEAPQDEPEAGARLAS